MADVKVLKITRPLWSREFSASIRYSEQAWAACATGSHGPCRGQALWSSFKRGNSLRKGKCDDTGGAVFPCCASRHTLLVLFVLIQIFLRSVELLRCVGCPLVISTQAAYVYHMAIDPEQMGVFTTYALAAVACSRLSAQFFQTLPFLCC